MIDYKERLLSFRDLKFTKKELYNSLPIDFYVEVPIVVCNIHLINLLEGYKAKMIDIIYLLDWVNTIWFSDWYSYCDEYCEAIAYVMNELEEIDENGFVLSEEQIKRYILILENNIIEI